MRGVARLSSGMCKIFSIGLFLLRGQFDQLLNLLEGRPKMYTDYAPYTLFYHRKHAVFQN